MAVWPESEVLGLRVGYLRYLLTAAVFLVYWQVRNFEFVTWDDNIHIYENSFLLNPSFNNVLFFWSNFYELLYIPASYTVWSGLAMLSQMLSHGEEAKSLNPMVFHLANLFFHIVNTLLVFGLLRSLLRCRFAERKREAVTAGLNVEYAAFAGALFFALHPMQAESVSWATEMKGLLCATFSFLSIRLYLRFVTGLDENGVKTARSGIRYYFLGFCAFAFALLSKPTAVSLPLVIVVIDTFALGRPIKDVFRSTALWFALAVVFVFLTTIAQPGELIKFNSPLWARPFIAGDALAFYFGKVLLPTNLTIDYGHSVEATLAKGQLYLTALVPLLLGLFIYRLKDRNVWFTTFGIMTAALLPVLGFIPFAFQFFSTVADRYAYIAMLGPALGVSSIFLTVQKKQVKVLLALVILLLGAGSFLQARTWKDGMFLYLTNLRINPDSLACRINFGHQLGKMGLFDKALSEYEFVLKKIPDAAIIHYNVGNIYFEKNEFEKSLASYRRSLEIDPANGNAHNNVGILFLEMGRFKDAKASFEKAEKIQPFNAAVKRGLGVAFIELNRPEEAIVWLTKSLEIEPDNAAPYYQLGLAWQAKNEEEKALEFFTLSSKKDPLFMPAREAIKEIMAKHDSGKE